MRIHAGIDVGKSTLTIALSDPENRPNAWRTTTIHTADPEWWRTLRATIPPGCIVVAEPTGTHYLTPIATALTGMNCQIWLVNTTTTGKVRAIHVSPAKSDRTDAQTLALLATWIAEGRPVHGARPHGYDPTAHLRQLVNAHESTTKTMNRASNHFQQLAHAVWPALAHNKTTYLRAIGAGAITPEEIHALAARPDLAALPAYENASARQNLHALAAQLPPGLPAPDLREQIAQLHHTMTAASLDLAALREQITQEIESPPFAEITRRLRTVPASSDLAIAAILVATRGDPTTFTRDEFRAALGAHPKRRQSGAKVTARRTKSGYRPAMKNLHLWTLRLLRETHKPNPVAAYYAATQTPHRMQAAVGKLAKLLHAVARSPEGYRVQ